METASKEQTEEMRAQMRIRNYMKGYVDSMALKCAVELRIADIINSHGNPISLPELASALPLPSVNLERLERIMKYWVHMGLFTGGSTDGTYAMTRCARYLQREEKTTMAPMVLGGLLEGATAAWHRLSSSLEGGPNAFERYHGMDSWEYLAARPETGQLFAESMACDSNLLLPALFQGCGSWLFKGISSLVDVGGGNGTVMMEMSKEFPSIKCTVFDRPNVIRNSKKPDGLDWVEGDMFQSVPSADAVLLKWILHDWSNEECVKILERCKEAIPLGEGKVIIIEIVLDDSTDQEPDLVRAKLTSDLDMMVYLTGKERTRQEWERLIYSAGYTRCQITPILALQSVIVAYP